MFVGENEHAPGAPPRISPSWKKGRLPASWNSTWGAELDAVNTAATLLRLMVRFKLLVSVYWSNLKKRLLRIWKSLMLMYVRMVLSFRVCTDDSTLISTSVLVSETVNDERTWLRMNPVLKPWLANSWLRCVPAAFKIKCIPKKALIISSIANQELDPKKLPPVCCQPRHTIIEKNEVIKNL